MLWLSTLLGEKAVQHSFKNTCLSCHQIQNIPSEMIYRRYLLKYSSRQAIRKQMFNYLKHPSVNRAIMPPQFFKKFPLKEATTLNDTELLKMIDLYISHYDIRPRLQIIPKQDGHTGL
jgi:hypothetical protein